MRYPYTANIQCEKTGAYLVTDLECEIDVSFEFIDGGPNYSVDAVYVDGQNIFFGDPLAQSIAARIAGQAEDEIAAGNRLLDKIMEREIGVSFAVSAAEHRVNLHREGV